MLSGVVRNIRTFQILVSNRNVRVSRLVASDHNAFGVREVANTGVLKRVELVRERKAKGFAHPYPLLSEAVHSYLLRTWSEILTE